MSVLSASSGVFAPTVAVSMCSVPVAFSFGGAQADRASATISATTADSAVRICFTVFRLLDVSRDTSPLLRLAPQADAPNYLEIYRHRAMARKRAPAITTILVTRKI